jgi:hypothetical protein
MKKICFLIAFFFFLPTKASAQQISLGIYPPIFQAVIKPEEYITQVFTIYNYSNNDIALKSSFVSFVPDGENGKTQLLETKTKLSPINFSYLNSDLNPEEIFIVKANSSQQVVLKIKPSPSAPEKDYYATLVFETQPVKSFLPLSNSITKTKIGSNLLLSVSKTTPKRKAEIKEFSLKNSFIIDSFDSLNFVVRVENTGNFFIKPVGKIKTSGWFGQKKEENLLPENILSGSIRKINCFQEKDNEIIVKNCSLDSGFLFGAYTSELEFIIEENSYLYQKKLKFFAFPWKLILAISVLTLITKFILVKKQ